MAKPKKKRGFRPITVDDQLYRWRFDGLLVVGAAERETQRLEVDIGWHDGWLHVNDEQKAPDFEPKVVTPSFVETAIRAGWSHGWNPGLAGPALRLSYRNETFGVDADSLADTRATE